MMKTKQSLTLNIIVETPVFELFTPFLGFLAYWRYDLAISSWTECLIPYHTYVSVLWLFEGLLYKIEQILVVH